MTEFWLLLQLLEMWEELMMQIVLFAGNFGLIIMFWSTPSVRSWWSQWGDMVASHCYSWWKVMVTLTRRAWPTLILVMFILVWPGLKHNVDLFSVTAEFSLQSRLLVVYIMVIGIGIYVVYMESIVEWNLWKFSMNVLPKSWVLFSWRWLE